MKKVVPLPTSVSKCSVPLCLSTTTVRAMARPCPVPLPTSLVVKKGSKMRERTSGGMPLPESPMEISTWSSSSRVATTIRPRSGVPFTLSPMACAALTMRFSTTWLISPA
jgi:hypothetical protein